MLSDIYRLYISVIAFGDSKAVHKPCESIKLLDSLQYAESEYQKV